MFIGFGHSNVGSNWLVGRSKKSDSAVFMPIQLTFFCSGTAFNEVTMITNITTRSFDSITILNDQTITNEKIMALLRG